MVRSTFMFDNRTVASLTLTTADRFRMQNVMCGALVGTSAAV
jgi:hypothetical protein